MGWTRRWTALILCLLLTGCAGTGGLDGGGSPSEDRLSIVAAIFPVWDWCRQILGDRIGDVDLILLMDGGVDLHSFQPSVDDLVTIARSDLFLYVGGVSDDWIRDGIDSGALSSDGTARQRIALLDLLGGRALIEEDELESDEDEEDQELDEHVWLSLRNAAFFVDRIAAVLGELDPAHADEYAANAEAYIGELSDLDAAYQETAVSGARTCLLFADRFPFRYLLEDYGLDHYAAFAGCSAETEASFSTVVSLAGIVDELDLPCVLTIDGGDGSLARTVVENTASGDAKILTLDSLQSVTRADAASTTYLGVMERDREVLREALA